MWEGCFYPFSVHSLAPQAYLDSEPASKLSNRDIKMNGINFVFGKLII